MSELKRTVHCGIDFNLMEPGDAAYREECLRAWLERNCSGNYRYKWSFADEFTIYFDNAEDYNRSESLTLDGIPHKS